MKKQWDVVVCGGGAAGSIAALAAARCGADVLLIEEYGFLGGTLTNAGVGPMMSFHADTKQVVGGIAQELIDQLMEQGGCIGHIEDTTGYASSVTPVDPEIMKYVLDTMMTENNVMVLYHAKVAGVELSGKKIKK